MNSVQKQPEDIPSACGKVILLGEHAVVYGTPALACGLPGAVRLRMVRSRENGLRVSVPAWDFRHSVGTHSMVGEALRVLTDALPCFSSFDLVFDADLPMGAGLGSSAALSVACVRTINALMKQGLDDEEVRDLAHRMEKVFHGTPSGLDDTLATFGGLCLFRRDGAWSDHDPEGEVLTHQARRLKHSGLRLVIAESGVPKSTKKMVANVRSFAKRHPGIAQATWTEITDLVSCSVKAIQQQDWPSLAEAMKRNQEILCELNLGVAQFKTMTDVAYEAGAMAAKLTGSGGGGCMVMLAPKKEEHVAEALTQAGFPAWTITLAPQEPGETLSTPNRACP